MTERPDTGTPPRVGDELEDQTDDRLDDRTDAVDATAEDTRRRRRSEVFGDVLPDATRDDLDEVGGPSRPDDDSRTRWIRQQVPPHHL